MTQTAADPIAPLIQAFRAEGRPRVWSLIVTFLGDAAEPRGGRVASARLSAVLGRIGIASGAMRAALSRLTAEDGLEREREGRASFHRLSRRRLAEFQAASRAIYAPPAAASQQHWVLTIGTKPDSRRGLQVAPGTVLWPAHAAPASHKGLRIAGQMVLSGQAPLALDHLEARRRMRADLASAASLATTEPLDAMATRLLLIHRWQRLTTRYPDLPGTLDPTGTSDLRAEMAGAYRALLPVSEAWLDSPGAGYAAMPVAGAGLLVRFAVPHSPALPEIAAEEMSI